MITIAIFSLLVVLVLIPIVDECFVGHYKAPIAGFFAVIFTVGVGYLLCWLTMYGITHATDDLVFTETKTTELHALDTGTDTVGSMFLLSGHSESGPYYTYLSRSEDGAYMMKHIATHNAFVYEVEGDGPAKMVEGRVRPESRLWSITSAEAKMKFYVPEGSVQEPEYRVSVKR